MKSWFAECFNNNFTKQNGGFSLIKMEYMHIITLEKENVLRRRSVYFQMAPKAIQHFHTSFSISPMQSVCRDQTFIQEHA